MRYGLAVASSAVAFAIASLIRRPVVELSPFLLFYAAVAVSSWYGGFGPGLLAVVLGSLVADYYLFEPRDSLLIREPLDVARLMLFLLVGALISWLNGQLRAANRLCEIRAAAASRNEARARRLAEANLIAVFFSDLDGNVHAGNDEFLRLAGCTREELAGGQVNWLRLTAPEHRHLDDRAVDELRRSRVCTPFEKEHLLRDGRRIPVLVGCAMLDDPPNEVAGFVLDLTDRKRAEAELLAHQGRLAALSSELMLTEERERRRIAAVLHDSIGQTLALAKLQLGAVARSEPGRPAADRLAGVEGLIDQVIGRTRSLTSEISPPVLYELGFEAAVRWLAGRIREQHGIHVEVRDDLQSKPLDSSMRLVLFEAVRELLVNVVKHAGDGAACTVSIGREGHHARVHVEDDGNGFAAPGGADGGGHRSDGFGLFNIRERLSRLGGRVEIRAQPGRGTSVTLVVPLTSDDNDGDEDGSGAEPK
jgi:PAS domain S-box-containing protein